MKQLFFLLLFPCLAMAQYPGNAGQKITLGEQTTADGLVYRGLASDTTRKPSVDTMAYILLDTNTNIIWQYKKAVNNAWTRVGGSISSGVTGVLPVANGGTGLTTFTAANRIPYSTSATALTTNSNFTYDGNRLTIPEAIFNGTTNYGYIFSAKASTSSGGAGIFIRGTQGADNTLPTTFGFPYVNIGGVENRLNAIQTIGFGFTNGTGGYLSPAEIGYLTNSLSGFTNGHLVFATRESTSNVAPDEKMRITNAGNVGIGTASPQSGYKLHVVDSVYVGGRVSAAGYTTRSDYNLKDEIQTLNYGINEVIQMQPVKYTYKSNGEQQLGFIAQDIGTLIPESVHFDEFMGVDYQSLIPILTKAIQEQNLLIKALEQRILTLENK